MAARFYAALALGVLLAGPALAKPTHPVHHAARHAAHRAADLRYAQSFYDYRSASAVRDEFYDQRREGMVVENLRSGDFTGGVGYGANGDVPGFVDGFGQTHFFVGNFRRMAPLGRFGMPRFGGPRFGQGFHGGFRGGFR